MTPVDEVDLEPQTMAVRITNKNDFTIRDMFDGVPYIFKPNVPLPIPVDAAHHIFGWHPAYRDEEGHLIEVDQMAMKTHIMKRFGWNTPDKMIDGRSDLFYGKLVLQPIRYRMTPVEVDDSGNPLEPTEEEATKQTRRRTAEGADAR